MATDIDPSINLIGSVHATRRKELARDGEDLWRCLDCGAVETWARLNSDSAPCRERG